MYRVLLVEDDRGIAEALCAQLGDWGFAVRAVENFRDVTGEFRAFDPQLVLLDLMLPFQSGYHWCAELRKISNVPVMFLSSAADNLNIVTAMNMGADDFIAKPFDCAVLVAKMQALLRRSYDFVQPVPALTCRGAQLCTDDQTLQFGAEKIALSKNEYRIPALPDGAEGQGGQPRAADGAAVGERSVRRREHPDRQRQPAAQKLAAAGLADFITTKFGVGYLVEDV